MDFQTAVVQCTERAEKLIHDIISQAMTYDRMSEQEANFVRQIWGNAREKYVTELVQRNINTSITNSVIADDIKRFFIPVARQRAQQAMSGQGGYHPQYGQQYQQGYYAAPQQGYQQQYNNGGYQYGYGGQPMQPQPMYGAPPNNDPWAGRYQQQAPPQQYNWSPPPTQTPPAQPEVTCPDVEVPDVYVAPEFIDGEVLQYESPDKQLKLTSRLMSKNNDQTINYVTVESTDSQYYSVEKLRQNLFGNAGYHRGDKHFMMHAFIKPHVVPIAATVFRNISNEIRSAITESRKRDTSECRLSIILKILSEQPRGPADAYDAFLTKLFNRYISYGRLTDKDNLNLRIQIPDLKSLVQLLRPDKKDETILQLHDKVTRFGETLQSICNTLFSDMFTAGIYTGKVIEQVDDTNVSLLSELIPRFKTDKDGNSVPIPDVMKLFNQAKYLKSAEKPEFATKASEELNRVLADFLDNYAVVFIPQIVIETDIDPLDLFKLTKDGKIQPGLVYRCDNDVARLLSEFFTNPPLNTGYSTSPIDMLLRGVAVDWHFGLGVSSDSRPWYGSVLV